MLSGPCNWSTTIQPVFITSLYALQIGQSSIRRVESDYRCFSSLQKVDRGGAGCLLLSVVQCLFGEVSLILTTVRGFIMEDFVYILSICDGVVYFHQSDTITARGLSVKCTGDKSVDPECRL